MRMVREGNNDKEDGRAEAMTMRMVRAGNVNEEDGQAKADDDKDGRGRQ